MPQFQTQEAQKKNLFDESYKQEDYSTPQSTNTNLSNKPGGNNKMLSSILNKRNNFQEEANPFDNMGKFHTKKGIGLFDDDDDDEDNDEDYYKKDKKKQKSPTKKKPAIKQNYRNAFGESDDSETSMVDINAQRGLLNKYQNMSHMSDESYLQDHKTMNSNANKNMPILPGLGLANNQNQKPGTAGIKKNMFGGDSDDDDNDSI